LHDLAAELERAQVLKPNQVPAGVVTMHARVRIRNLTTGERQDLVLVSPAEADVGARLISVLAPLGTALLGYREGDEVEWLMPAGLHRLRIERVLQAADETRVTAATFSQPAGGHQCPSSSENTSDRSMPPGVRSTEDCT
jgi:hypothetical protein